MGGFFFFSGIRRRWCFSKIRVDDESEDLSSTRDIKGVGDRVGSDREILRASGVVNGWLKGADSLCNKG